jgi:hypothetical protein
MRIDVAVGVDWLLLYDLAAPQIASLRAPLGWGG